jgi:type IV secretory pathway VirB2 component (pilin)
MMVANGPFSGGVDQHDRGSGRFRAEVNVVDGTIRVVDDNETGTIIHGFLMTIAWGILVPVSLATALFLKHWAPKEEGAVAPWFKVHVILQVTAVLLTFAGIVVKLVELDEWLFNSFHTKLGTVIFALAVFQIVNGMLRAGKDRGTARTAWQVLHILTGAGTATLSIVAIISGLFIANATDWIMATVIVFIAVWIGGSFIGIYFYSRRERAKAKSEATNRRKKSTNFIQDNIFLPPGASQ